LSEKASIFLTSASTILGKPEEGQMTITEQIKNKVEGLPIGEPFSNTQFLSIGTRAAVDQSLSRLVKIGTITRVSRGVYVKPKLNRYVGAVVPAPMEVVKAKLPQNEILQIHGAEAARQMQLSTQVPTQPVFYTQGSNREFRVGGLRVKLRHVSPRKLVLGTRPAGVAFSALWYVGKQNVTPSVIAKVKQKLPPEEFRFLSESKWAMPAWMANAFHQYEHASK
jgi:hypothetical protein